MEKKQYVDYSSCSAGTPGSGQNIAGCLFMLAPMTDRYEDVIMGAVGKVDTSNVWSSTGRMGTVYRGRAADVIDAVEACFAFAWKPDVHMTLEMTLSGGCPGDSDEDYVLGDAAEPANRRALEEVHFPVDCKFSLYPLGTDAYMKGIEDVVNRAIDMGIFSRTAHYATELKGDVHELFDYFSWAFEYCREHFSHTVLEITMSVNSPTAE